MDQRFEALPQAETRVDGWRLIERAIYDAKFDGLIDGMKTGLLIGEERGFDEGLERGRREMELVTSRAILRDLLEARFGTLPPSLLLQIEQTQDATLLRTATRQVLTIAEPNELVLGMTMLP